MSLDAITPIHRGDLARDDDCYYCEKQRQLLCIGLGMTSVISPNSPANSLNSHQNEPCGCSLKTNCHREKFSVAIVRLPVLLYAHEFDASILGTPFGGLIGVNRIIRAKTNGVDSRCIGSFRNEKSLHCIGTGL